MDLQEICANHLPELRLTELVELAAFVEDHGVVPFGRSPRALILEYRER